MNVYEIVTAKLIESLEAGSIPWSRPWSTEGHAINYVTRKEYRGVNRMLLQGGEYLTFNQIKERNGTIKTGCKASIVVFFKNGYTTKDEDTGDETFHSAPILRYYTVFSIHSVDGIDSKLPPAIERENNPIESAEKIFTDYIKTSGITLSEENPNRAYYSPMFDSINLPRIAQFNNSEEFYSTSFHEAAHSTGHKSRLNRLDKVHNFGSVNYSKEELVAEIASAFLCELAGMDTTKTIPNSAAYIRSWSEALKADPKMAVSAASASEKACDYILGVK